MVGIVGRFHFSGDNMAPVCRYNSPMGRINLSLTLSLPIPLHSIRPSIWPRSVVAVVVHFLHMFPRHSPGLSYGEKEGIPYVTPYSQIITRFGLLFVFSG